MKRTLSLKREALTELSAEELVAVAGGVQAITVQGATCPLVRCAVPSNEYTCFDCATRYC